MTVKILADSACDLPLSYFKEHNVTLFPLKVHLDDKEYEDLITIDSDKVYEGIRSGRVPKTSQVSPLLFEETFTNMAENKEKGIYIAFSSQLSGTYQTAVMILNQVKENYPDFEFEIIDSKCASLGCGLVVQEAVKLAQLNTPMAELIERAKFHALHMEHLFTVDDLDYLAKGGRVSKASAFLGGLLNIKPLLNVEDGKLVPIEKLRGKKKLMRRVIELMAERGTALDKQVIGISHAQCEDTVMELKEMMEQELSIKQVYISSIGSAVGSHTGPGTFAIFFLNELNK